MASSGLFTDLYYVREGRKNDYALQFQVPVSPNISVLYFNWQNLGQTPIAYSVGLQVNEMHVLDESNINIRKEGEVPFKEQVIRISIPCNPCVTSEVDVNILFNFSFPLKSGTNLTSLSLKRKKVCVAKITPVSMCSQAFLSQSRKKSPHLTLISSSDPESPIMSSTSSSSTTVPGSDSQSAALVVTIGYASAFTFLVVFFLLMCTRRSSAGKETSVLTRHVDAASAGFSRASSDFSLKKIPASESGRSFSRHGHEIDGIWFL